ncbi:MAG: 1-(5-phosphoribosyl)-5-[(5-phosphoribosylamino)methylideneamino]imidazole-4-carboxamide isomerase [Gammaproteobacteria bacterium]|nr:1-(5-phosphoribosyl)-5-[(5-phosphoribosylamino)methylideneamino]imidazole-4-carboxamide isomerase [Gammaproteobacteria bacterium]|tara:strand:- start:4805 stop:5539 length:735 start_codon:yes stop_codon:yes gene_type:complete
MIKIFPAIDIKNKKCVRLSKGDYSQVIEYSDNPLEIAQRWVDQGCKNLHIIDLDGASSGTPSNFEVINSIRKKFTDLFIQVGGGIRNESTLRQYFTAGIDRVIIGTKSISDPDFIPNLSDDNKSKIIIDIAIKNNAIASKGWKETNNNNIKDFVEFLELNKISEIVYTDINKDGMLEGINFDCIQKFIKNTSISTIASGGITTIDDIHELVKLDKDGLSGIVIGKALYENKINLKEALEINGCS